MRFGLLLGLSLLLCSLGSVYALTSQEINALGSILKVWPVLTRQAPPWNESRLNYACLEPFYGITCTSEPEEHVTGLIFDHITLNTPLPTAIGDFPCLKTVVFNQTAVTGDLIPQIFASSALQRVEFIKNTLDGTITAAAWDNLPSLQTLVLEELALSGSIPETIARAKSLKHLKISSMDLLSTFPAAVWTQLEALEELVIAAPLVATQLDERVGRLKNLSTLVLLLELSGSIPESLYSLKKLQVLDLSRAELHGTISESIGALTELRGLRLMQTEIRGTIPASIGRLSQLEELDLSKTSIRGPLPPELGQLTRLKVLRLGILSGPGLGQLPNELGFLHRLEVFEAMQSGLTGTIPASFSNLSLTTIQLENNALTGELPKFGSKPNSRSFLLSLSYNLLTGGLDNIANLPFGPEGSLYLVNNRLSGTIPEILFGQHAPRVLLASRNQLSGTIPSTAFSTLTGWIDLSDNNLSGPLPSQLNTTTSELGILDLHNNAFSSTIPPSFLQLRYLNTLDLSFNRLTGDVPTWTPSPSRKQFFYINFSNNQLSGTLPDFTDFPVNKLTLSKNQIRGSTIRIPKNAIEVDYSSNQLSGDLLDLDFHSGTLRELDLGYNQLSGVITEDIMASSLRFLDLSHNKLTGTLPDGQLSLLISFDASFNQLQGDLPLSTNFQLLSSLKLNDNNFTGVWRIHANFLSQIDISNNALSFRLDSLEHFTSLVSLLAANNSITGDPGSLDVLKQLALLDLTDNDLSALSLGRVRTMFKNRLQMLSISNNTNMPVIGDMTETGPWRTTLNQPSHVFSRFVECYSLSFAPNRSDLVFRHDENLFNYSQCDCKEQYYGRPPSNCYDCPAESHCVAQQIRLNPDNYLFSVPTHLLNTNQPHQSPLQAETCILSPAMTDTNCIGLADFNVGTKDASMDAVIAHLAQFGGSQCREGSEGRLCSRCLCRDPIPYSSPRMQPPIASSVGSSSAGSSCYFLRGMRCISCKKVFKLSQSLPALIGGVVGVTLALSIVMLLVLRSRRTRSDVKWELLPLWKRVWYRLTDGAKQGLVSIAVLFIQILVELTHWDDYALKSVAMILNGNLEGLGMICFFPTILNDPFYRLLLKLLVPIAGCALVVTSIAIAELFYRCCYRKSGEMILEGLERDELRAQSFQLLSDQEGIDSYIQSVEYPATMLLSSSIISVLQFFYFGTALTSTEFFFSSKQAHSHVLYVQAHPWMLYSAAAPMRHLSIPWLVFIVGGLPVLLLGFTWRFRHQVYAPTLASYFGTLFVRFRPRFYWWAIVNVLKKLVVALVLRGIAPSDALQAISIVLAIGVPHLLQTTFHPWKSMLENLMDPVGGFLLIASLFASASANLRRSTVVFGLVLALDLIYVVTLAVLIIYRTVMDPTEYQKKWSARFPSSEHLLFSDEDDDQIEQPTSPSSHRREHGQNRSGGRLKFDEPLLRQPLRILENSRSATIRAASNLAADSSYTSASDVEGIPSD